MKNIGLILAGGLGKRINRFIPKQFIQINSKPLIIYTLEIFDKANIIDEIYVVCIEKYFSLLKGYIKDYNLEKKITLVKGGENGFLSTFYGIKSIIKKEKNTNANIIIHDANRPFIKETNITNLIRICEEKGNAVSAIQSIEILAHSTDGISSCKSYNRENIYRLQKPECYKLHELIDIYNKAIDLGMTDIVATCDIFMRLGKPIYFSKGTPENIKITYEEDLIYAKKLLK